MPGITDCSSHLAPNTLAGVVMLVAASRLRVWFYRYVVALVLTSVTMAVGVGGGWWYINRKLDNAKQVNLNLDVGGGNYLILGSDTRQFAEQGTNDPTQNFGRVGGQRADTMMILRVDPKTRKGLLVSIPRDTWVDIPGRGMSKINASYGGGPQLVIDTIRKNFRVPINHYVEVDFGGFRNIVDAIGGVTMYVPAPARDTLSGLDVKSAGCLTFDGNLALAWVRSRHFESFESGRWHYDPTSDYGRIQRQQDFIRRLMRQSLKAGTHNPLKGDRLINAALKNVQVDSGLNAGGILKLARVFKSADPNDVEMLTLPSYPANRASQSVVLLKPEAEDVFRRLRGDEPAIPAKVAPADVAIRVLNGAGTVGVASRTADTLQKAGFRTSGAGDADRFSYRETEIRYRTGAKDDATLVQKFLGLGKLVEVSALRDVDVELVIGRDFKEPSPPSTSNQQGLVSLDTALIASVSAAPTTTAPPPVPTTAKPVGAPTPNC